MGTLRIHGTIDLAQFWPVGESDADTTKIKLVVGKKSFEYKKEGASKFSATNAYKDAISKGQVSKQVITTSKKTGLQTITVRLQGIDAPELHYRGAPLKTSSAISAAKRKNYNALNAERRQCYAETSTHALSRHLKKFATAAGVIKAVFETNVAEPADAIDTYGRFVGNIRIGSNDINSWLVENGWGHPAFYTSMSKEEIGVFMAAWKKGKTKSNRPGKSLSLNATEFDWKLLYREPHKDNPIAFTPGEDKGKVLMPKIFRRQVAWMVSKETKVISGSTSFQAYLKKKPDQLVLLDDFLTNGINSAKVFALHEFVSTNNKVSKKPEELVFKEKSGTLENSNGQKITAWK